MNTQIHNPVFLLGMTRRSGTNFLMRLLTLHPDLASTDFSYEDYMLSEVHWLHHYAHRVYKRWNPSWEIDPNREALLLQSLGQGLIDCLTAFCDGKRLVTKTPSVENLPYFFDLFPNAYLLILIRDGRDVVESMVRSFRRAYEEATRIWVRAGRTIVDFDKANCEKGLKYLMVRYEDLVLDLDSQLETILEFLALDSATYDFDAARQLPVFGSSTFQRGEGERQKWHWKPVTKTSEFQPLERWRTWTPYRRQRFSWLAGSLLRELGYEEKWEQSSWTFYHPMIDLVWQGTRRFSGLVPKGVKRRLKARQLL
jgi:hypothetical protein